MFFASSVLDLPTPYIYSYFGKAFSLLRYAESRKQDKCRIPCLFGTRLSVGVAQGQLVNLMPICWAVKQ